MRQSLRLRIAWSPASHLLHEQHGTAAFREVVTQSQNLAAVVEHIARQMTDVGERVKHYACRSDTIYRLEDGPGRLRQLDIGRRKKGISLFLFQSFLGNREVEHLDGVDIPPMRHGGVPQFALRFREGDPQTSLAGLESADEEMKADGRFAGARISLNQIEVTAGETAP
jgi:hypothetical protein